MSKTYSNLLENIRLLLQA